jgi:hypothetical protein
MRYLKPHPIYEGKAELDELMDIIDNTPEGTDLKGICELEPKKTGRIFVHPRGLASSKTFIEKTYSNDPNFTRVWHYTSLSNGKPFGGDRFFEAKYAIRDLWAYILSKNVPEGYKKDEFKRWLLDDQACGFHGKGADGRTIIDAFVQVKKPQGMITDADQYFATPGIQQKLEDAGLTKSGTSNWFTLGFKIAPFKKMLSALSISMIGSDNSMHLSDPTVQVIIVPHGIKFKANKSGGWRVNIKVGGLVKDLHKLENRIIAIFGSGVKAFVKEMQEYSLRMNLDPRVAAYKKVEFILLNDLVDRITNLDSPSAFDNLDDNLYRLIADALKDDIELVASLPSDLSVRILKLLGYNDTESEAVRSLRDVGIF